MFCAMLGAFAGNVALTYGARGGVYIAGGIAPRILDHLAGSAFRQRFEHKGRVIAALSRKVIGKGVCVEMDEETTELDKFVCWCLFEAKAHSVIVGRKPLAELRGRSPKRETLWVIRHESV